MPVALAFPRLLSAVRPGGRDWRIWLFVSLWALIVTVASVASLTLHGGPAAVLADAMVTVPPVAPLLMAGNSPRDQPLSVAPDPGVTEEAAEGRLPVAVNGRLPRFVYAYPFNQADARPRIAVVLSDAGPQPALLADALQALPGAVAVGLSAGTPHLSETMASVRAAGHEMLLTVPMDGIDPAAYDPGPGALRGGLKVDENLHRLRLLLAAGSGYVGLALDPQAGLLNDPALSEALLDETRRRGLLWLAPSEGMYAFADQGRKLASPVLAEEVIRLDTVLTPAGLDAAFTRLESLARLKGKAVAVGAPYPLLVDALTKWLPALNDKGIALAPLSALAPQPKGVSVSPLPAMAGPEAPTPQAVSAAHREAH